MLGRKTLILAKVESTYGSDPTPTTSDDALIVFDFEITPEIDSIERIDRGVSLSRLKELGGKQRVKVTFTTELRGSGAAGTAPKGDSALFQACGLDEALVVSTSATYTFLSAALKSATLYVYQDGIQHQLHGCVGNFEIIKKPGETAKINWEFMCLWEDYTDVSYPTSYTPNSTVPVVCKNMTVSLDSYEAIISSLSIKSNNTISERSDLNAATGIAGFQITDRNPEGEIAIEAILLATKNYLTKLTTDATVALSSVLSGGAGNITTITAGQCRLRQIPFSEEEGIITHPIPFQLARSSGNDELTIAFT